MAHFVPLRDVCSLMGSPNSLTGSFLGLLLIERSDGRALVIAI